ncbi:MAG: nucleoside hydrolase [Phycisphaerales bacterium]
MSSSSKSKVRLILDTDMGNDIDDALALAMIHALQSRGECKLLAVTLSKDNAYAPMYVDIVNTFYGRGDIPIGIVTDGVTPDDGPYNRPVIESTDHGKPRYARSYKPDTYPEAVTLLRSLLAREPDRSVVPVMIGFSTNMARLLTSPPDEISSLTGRELFARKVRHVVMMAADFSADVLKNPTLETREYNVIKDISSAKCFIDNCPTPIVFTGVEVGRELMYPGSTTEHLYGWTKHHPVAEAYRHYKQMPYDRPTWDLTAVLEAVRPGRGYFGVSEPGRAMASDDGIVRFESDARGKHLYLTLIESKREEIVDLMVELVTQPVAQPSVKITAALANPSRRPAHSGTDGTDILLTSTRGRDSK